MCIIKLIQIDHVTCAWYYDHKTFSFHKFMMKDHSFFESIFIFSSTQVEKIKNYGSEYDHGLLWIKMHLFTNCTKMKNGKICKYMYISCVVSLFKDPLQKVQLH